MPTHPSRPNRHSQAFESTPSGRTESAVTSGSGAVSACGHTQQGDLPRVLVVDPSADTRQVLRTILERRGIQFLDAAQPRQGLAIAHDRHPDVIVLDLESFGAESYELASDYDRQSQVDDSSLVFLGRIPDGQLKTSTRCLAKPYHYAPLIRTIEELLDLG